MTMAISHRQLMPFRVPSMLGAVAAGAVGAVAGGDEVVRRSAGSCYSDKDTYVSRAQQFEAATRADVKTLQRLATCAAEVANSKLLVVAADSGRVLTVGAFPLPAFIDNCCKGTSTFVSHAKDPDSTCRGELWGERIL